MSETLENPLSPRGDLSADPAIREWLRPLEHAGEGRKTGPRHVGGKAAMLGRLLREGFPVPRGWVLEARRFEEAIARTLPRGHDLPSLIKIAGTRAGIDRAARARDRVLSEPLPSGLSKALELVWRAVEASAPWGLAVRSSATCEDRDTTSLAGIATTLLGVRGPEELGVAIRRVWASLFLPSALAYLRNADLRDASMAVVLQQMVRAEAAGVLFTAPPPGLEGEHWRAEERLINATFGLGAPVVEGASATDTIRLARHGGAVVAAAIAEKKRALVVGEHAIEEQLVPPLRAREPALGAEALRALGRLSDRLEALDPALFGKGPFDLEFAVEASEGEGCRVYLLQIRPVTGGGFPEGGDARTVWSRANLGEALPGAATPLTWSIARAFSDKGFREAFGALGCHVPRGTVLVGNVHGRFYLNLSAFMRIAAQVPGLSPRALLTASGGANEAAIEALEAEVQHVARRGFWMRLPLTAPRLFAQQMRLEREVAAFEVEAERRRRALYEMDLGLLPDDALATSLTAASALLERTGTLMLACASASLASHLALCALLERVASRKASARDEGEAPDTSSGPGSSFGAAEPLAQALAGGVRELDSAGPAHALSHVAALARGEEAARERLVSGSVRGPADLPPGPTRRALEDFLDVYGDRAVREAELATPRWREDPSALIAMLISTLRAPEADADKALGRARALSDREMARLETRLAAPLLLLVRNLVERAQRFTRLRERMRSWVTRVLGMLRIIALDVDRRLRRIDPALPEGSVFYCTYEELIVALRSGRAEIGHVVRLRRAEHLRDAARPDPPATFIGRPPPLVLPPVEGTRLVGLPASSGVVEGRARVLEPGARGLDALEPGEVLVSRMTDVGLSPLFLVAAAVVTELGGPLSHAAVVAREYGVPAVVNVPGATLAIKTGDLLRVDGDRGVVERIEAPCGSNTPARG